MLGDYTKAVRCRMWKVKRNTCWVMDVSQSEEQQPHGSDDLEFCQGGGKGSCAQRTKRITRKQSYWSDPIAGERATTR